MVEPVVPARGAGPGPAVAERRRGWALALAGTLLAHALIAWLATKAPAPRHEPPPPKPKKPIAARVVPAKPPPRAAPPAVPIIAPPPEAPKPPPEAPKPPPEAPPKPPPEAPKPPETTTPPPVAPPEAGAAAADPSPAPAPPPKRSGGRTLTGKEKAGKRKTTVADGKGRVADFGDYDATAGAGSATPPPASPPAGSPKGKADGRVERESPAAPEPAPPRPEPKKAIEKLVPPVPKSRPAGRFPPGVPRSSQPLRVVLSLSVTASGAVEAVKVVSGQGPELDAEARRLALTIKFEPARRGGTAVPMTIPWTVTFK